MPPWFVKNHKDHNSQKKDGTNQPKVTQGLRNFKGKLWNFGQVVRFYKTQDMDKSMNQKDDKKSCFHLNSSNIVGILNGSSKLPNITNLSALLL